MKITEQDLEKYKFLDTAMARKSAEIERTISLSKTLNSKETQSSAQKLDELSGKLRSDDIAAAKAEVEKAIAEVTDDLQRELLTLRYIQGKTWDDIAEVLYFEPDSKGIYKLRKKALSTIENQLTK